MVELLTAAALLLVVLAAVYGIWFGLQRTYSFTEEDMKAQTEARAAMNEMVELIRTAREPDFYTTAALDVVIVRAEPNLLVVWTDMDRDADHDLELVRFRVDIPNHLLYRDDSHSQTSDLTFAAGTSVRLVGNWVSNDAVTEANWLFSYRGKGSTALPLTEAAPGDPPHVADPTQIREVRIRLMVDVQKGKLPEHHELVSVVQPRNLRTY